MQPSPQQSNIYARIEDTTDSLMIVARAGTGKTTTIVAGLDHIDPSASTAFVAFNKSVATELQGRVASNVKASTLNSLGNGNIYRQFGKVPLNENKCRDIYRRSGGDRECEGSVLSLVSLAKGAGQRYPDFADLAETYQTTLIGDPEYILRMAHEVFEQSHLNSNMIDFDDQVYYPAVGVVSCRKFDNMMVDEYQDLNGAQIQMLFRSIRPGGRIIAVGDPHQSIYDFRGANPVAQAHLRDVMDMKLMPLTVSYRCCRAVIRLAQTIVPDIEAAPSAKEGAVEVLSETRMLNGVKNGDLILCRVNAPLVPIALNLIRSGVKAAIRGRDIGGQLANLIGRVQRIGMVSTLPEMLSTLTYYVRQEVLKLAAEERNGQAVNLQDQYDTIVAVADGCRSIQEVLGKIATIFSDDRAPVMLSSIHRAKGSEAERVFIIRGDLLPHPMATTYRQREQEVNLKYVAYTRAKSFLGLVS